MQKSKTSRERDIETEDLKVVVAPSSGSNELKIGQTKSLESFSKSSENLQMPISKLESRKKARSSSRTSEKVQMHDDLVTKDTGESYMTNVMKRVSDSMENDEKLRLHNIKLEGKISRLFIENDEVVKERNYFKSQKDILTNKINYYSQVEIKNQTLYNENLIKSQELQATENQLSLLNDELNKKMKEMQAEEHVIKSLNIKISEIEERYSKIILEYDEKDYVVKELKKKVSELSSQLELTKIYRENSEFQVERMKSESQQIESERKSLNEQLKAIENVRDQLQDEIKKLTAQLVEITQERENFSRENWDLKLKLKKFSETKLKELTELLQKMEKTQKELISMNEDKDNLESKVFLLQETLDEKISMLDKEKWQNTQLEGKIRDLDEELNEEKERLERYVQNLRLKEEYNDDLRKQLNAAESELVKKSERIKQLEYEQNNIQGCIQNLNANILEKDSGLEKLNEDLNSIRGAHDRILKERNDAYEGIENMRNKINEVEQTFEVTRQDLWNKESALKLAEELNDSLKSNLLKEQEKVEEKEGIIHQLVKERYELSESVNNLQMNQKGMLEEVDSLRNCLSLANHKILQLESTLQENENIKQENEGYLNEISVLKKELETTKNQLEELLGVQQKYTDLLQSYQRIKDDYFDLSGKHDLLTNEYQQVTKDLREQLTESQNELARLVNQKEDVIMTAQKDLQYAEKKKSELATEIENVKFTHTVELASKEEQFRKELEQSKKEFSDMCQEKIRCEGAIDKLQKHIETINSEYKEKLNGYKTKMLTLQQQSSEFAEYENKCKWLNEELERKRGELEAILESWKNFKKHVKEVENNLAQKEKELIQTIKNSQSEMTQKQNEIMEINIHAENLKNTIYNEKQMREYNEKIVNEKTEIIINLESKLDYYKEELEQVKRENTILIGKCKYLTEENQTFKYSEIELLNNLKIRDQENQDLIKIHNQLKDKLDENLVEKNLENISLKNLLDEVELRKRQLDQCQMQSKLRDENYADELKEMNKFIQEIQCDRDSKARQIELTTQEDIIAIAVVKRLRNEVRKILLKHEVNNNQENINNELLISKDQMDELKKLLADTNDPSVIPSTKPLARLSSCIDDLRFQVDSLQMEISMEFEEIHS